MMKPWQNDLQDKRKNFIGRLHLISLVRITLEKKIRSRQSLISHHRKEKEKNHEITSIKSYHKKWATFIAENPTFVGSLFLKFSPKYSLYSIATKQTLYSKRPSQKKRQQQPNATDKNVNGKPPQCLSFM